MRFMSYKTFIAIPRYYRRTENGECCVMSAGRFVPVQVVTELEPTDQVHNDCGGAAREEAL